MDEIFERDDNLEAVINDLIDTEEDLIYLKAANVKVICLKTDRAKIKNGVKVFADCEAVTEKYKWATNAKFMITVYTPNIYHFSETQKRILLFQQLLKIVPGKDEEFLLRDYDVQDFSIIVKRYGTSWAKEPGLFDDKD